MKILKYLYLNSLILMLFLYIFMPPIFLISTIHYLGLISWVLIIFFLKREFLNIVKFRNIHVFSLGIIASSIYLFLVLIFTTKDYEQLKSLLYIPLEVIPTAIAITILFKRLDYSLDSIMKVILNVGLIQSIIAIAMLVVPVFKNMMLNTFYYETYVIGQYAPITEFRIFGYTDGFTFSMPIVQAVLAIIAMIYGVEKSHRYYIYIPFLVFSALINARISLVVFVAGVLIYSIIQWQKISKIVSNNIIFVFVGLSICVLFISLILLLFSQSTIVWLNSFISDTIALFQGEKKGFYEVYSKFIFIPKGLALLVGSGIDYSGNFHPIYMSSSDIGYVNDLFLGGLFYSIYLYRSFICFYLSPKKFRKSDIRGISIIILIITFIANFKGFAFRVSGFTNLFILITILLTVYNEDNLKNKI